MKDQKEKIYIHELSKAEAIWKVLRHEYNNYKKPAGEYVCEEAIFLYLEEAIIYAAEITETYSGIRKMTCYVVESSLYVKPNKDLNKDLNEDSNKYLKKGLKHIYAYMTGICSWMVLLYTSDISNRNDEGHVVELGRFYHFYDAFDFAEGKSQIYKNTETRSSIVYLVEFSFQDYKNPLI